MRSTYSDRQPEGGGSKIVRHRCVFLVLKGNFVFGLRRQGICHQARNAIFDGVLGGTFSAAETCIDHPDGAALSSRQRESWPASRLHRSKGSRWRGNSPALRMSIFLQPVWQRARVCYLNGGGIPIGSPQPFSSPIAPTIKTP